MFNVGDEIVVLNIDREINREETGARGTIERVCLENNYPYRCNIMSQVYNINKDFAFKKSEIKLIGRK